MKIIYTPIYSVEYYASNRYIDLDLGYYRYEQSNIIRLRMN